MALDPQINPKTILNKRIQFEDQLATVRYVGPVPPTKGEWLGVEWDNVSRGKHDGVHEGTHYFTCSVPNSGSFIRFSSKINIGQSFLSALIQKYVGDEDETSNYQKNSPYDAQKDLESMYWAGNTKIEVEALGWEKIRQKQRHLDRLFEVGLSFEQISNAGVPGEIAAVCPNIVDLNLSKNLIADWDTIARICEQLEKLEVLRLNYNRFQILHKTPTFTDAFKHLKSLSLNYTRITWNQLGFNNIHHFHNGHDSKSNLVPNSQIRGFDKLKILNLESNCINNWSEITFFANLKSLEILYLNGNLIDTIFYGGEKGIDFAKLRYLNISENAIQHWQSIDELNKFPALKELRIKKNKFLEGTKPDESNVAIIGRIKQLTMLNGSTISSGDRIDAERYYLRLIVRDLKGISDDIVKQHPRFKELCELHGTPTADELSFRASSNILKDRLLALTITSRLALEEKPIKKISKNLLGTMTIRNLKNLLHKLFGIQASRQKLFHVPKSQVKSASESNAMAFIEINDDLRQLSYYDIASGDEIANFCDGIRVQPSSFIQRSSVSDPIIQHPKFTGLTCFYLTMPHATEQNSRLTLTGSVRSAQVSQNFTNSASPTRNQLTSLLPRVATTNLTDTPFDFPIVEGNESGRFSPSDFASHRASETNFLSDFHCCEGNFNNFRSFVNHRQILHGDYTGQAGDSPMEAYGKIAESGWSPASSTEGSRATSPQPDPNISDFAFGINMAGGLPSISVNLQEIRSFNQPRTGPMVQMAVHGPPPTVTTNTGTPSDGRTNLDPAAGAMTAMVALGQGEPINIVLRTINPAALEDSRPDHQKKNNKKSRATASNFYSIASNNPGAALNAPVETEGHFSYELLQKFQRQQNTISGLVFGRVTSQQPQQGPGLLVPREPSSKLKSKTVLRPPSRQRPVSPLSVTAAIPHQSPSISGQEASLFERAISATLAEAELEGMSALEEIENCTQNEPLLRSQGVHVSQSTINLNQLRLSESQCGQSHGVRAQITSNLHESQVANLEETPIGSQFQQNTIDMAEFQHLSDLQGTRFQHDPRNLSRGRIAIEELQLPSQSTFVNLAELEHFSESSNMTSTDWFEFSAVELQHRPTFAGFSLHKPKNKPKKKRTELQHPASTAQSQLEPITVEICSVKQPKKKRSASFSESVSQATLPTVDLGQSVFASFFKELGITDSQPIRSERRRKPNKSSIQPISKGVGEAHPTASVPNNTLISPSLPITQSITDCEQPPQPPSGFRRHCSAPTTPTKGISSDLIVYGIDDEHLNVTRSDIHSVNSYDENKRNRDDGSDEAVATQKRITTDLFWNNNGGLVSLGAPGIPIQALEASKKRPAESLAVEGTQVGQMPITVPGMADATTASITTGEVASPVVKPYKCSVPGCPKAYKNANGLKYHNKHGHVTQEAGGSERSAEKPYKCRHRGCTKSYKNQNGLKYHIQHHHGGVEGPSFSDDVVFDATPNGPKLIFAMPSPKLVSSGGQNRGTVGL
ncbi:hypothetical protein G9A89_017190 [Geosiphon pyriformis]|nr:hypothetical protein G9A89_017190 [Geosiphon pyriformis]